MKKIAVLIPDFFWSSIPYDGLPLFHFLSKKIDCHLMMFNDDIRLNKTKFFSYQKYCFDNKEFLQVKNLIKLIDWDDFYNKSKEFDLIISNVHLAPKGERAELLNNFNSRIQCKFMTIDIGGSDVLTQYKRGHYFCVKGPIWKSWLEKMGVDEKCVFNTGCPHYDLYHTKPSPKSCHVLSSIKFQEKYNLNSKKKKLLIAPSNPSSHQEQFTKNLGEIKDLYNLANSKGYEVLIKTYPNDYVFYDEQKIYTGIYKRSYSRHRPQYEIISKIIPEATIIDSQDHFIALICSDKLFNMSGSHFAWETLFTKTKSYSIGYKNQSYYGGASYLPEFILLPDKFVNINVNKIHDIFDETLDCDKEKCLEYINKSFSLSNISDAVETVLNYE